MKEIGPGDLRTGDLVLRDKIVAKYRAGDIDKLLALLERHGFPLVKLNMDGADQSHADQGKPKPKPPSVAQQEMYQEASLTPVEVPIGRTSLKDMDDDMNAQGETGHVRAGVRRAIVRLHNGAVNPDVRDASASSQGYNPERPVLYFKDGEACPELNPIDKSWNDRVEVDLDELVGHLRHIDIRKQDGVGPHVANAMISFLNEELTREFEQLLTRQP